MYSHQILHVGDVPWARPFYLAKRNTCWREMVAVMNDAGFAGLVTA